MTMVIAPAMTPKQKQVFDLLGQGVAPSQIAKRLRISSSGVYGHMRNMREAGITLPGEEAGFQSPPETTPPALLTSTTGNSANSASNGHVEPEVALSAAVKANEERAAEIAVEIEALQSQIASLQEEGKTVQERVQKYTAALAALA